MPEAGVHQVSKGMRILAFLFLVAVLVSCAPSDSGDERRLPTGAVLDPAGSSLPLGSMPLAMIYSPDSSRVIVLLCGYREQGLQVVDLGLDQVVQTVVQPAAFLGLAFAPDGKTLYASGGYRDVVYRYAWQADSLALADSLRLGDPARPALGLRYPSGLAISPDGARLYVAENLADSLAVVETATGKVLQRLPTGRYPYGVVVAPNGRVFVSAWGGSWVSTFMPAGGLLQTGARIDVGRHPSALALNASGSRLFAARASFDRIAVVDTRSGTILTELSDAAPHGPSEGQTPNALALAGGRLYVAEADNNAVSIFRLSASTLDDPGAGAGSDALLGRVPVEWYPTAVLASGESLLVLNGKGAGTGGPNPGRGHPGLRPHRDPLAYTLGQTSGSLMQLPDPGDRELKRFSERVRRAAGRDRDRVTASYPPFRHVIYVIRENRTYDQVFGDLAAGDGDTSLVYFPRDVTPNAHALAERFGLFDRFFVNAEVSGDGHNWSTAAYAADYVEKTIPSNYSDRGRSYDYEGHNRDELPEDDVNEPGNGYLWDLAARGGIWLRNYGEFTERDSLGHWVGVKPVLTRTTDPLYPGWDLSTPDQTRADEWLREFRTYADTDSMPDLMIVKLPNDHTSGAKLGAPTPRAQVADNDLALGRVVEAVARSPFWKDTVIFVLEDDAQDGPDHVDSHRSVLLVISAYNRPGVIHRFTNTTDVVATIAGILGLGSLSQFDYHGRPLADLFAADPDGTPFTALRPAVDLEEKNADQSSLSIESESLDFSLEDRADEDALNRILWAAVKGRDRPYPYRIRTSLPAALPVDAAIR